MHSTRMRRVRVHVYVCVRARVLERACVYCARILRRRRILEIFSPGPSPPRTKTNHDLTIYVWRRAQTGKILADPPC